MTATRLNTLLATGALLLTACSGGGDQPRGEDDPSAPTSSATTTQPEPEPEPTPEPVYVIDPPVTIYGKRALNPCRLAPPEDVRLIFGSSMERVPLTASFLEQSIPYPGFNGGSLDANLRAECTLTGSYVVGVQVEPVYPDSHLPGSVSSFADRSRPSLRRLQGYLRKAPDDNAAALLRRLRTDAREISDLEGPVEGRVALSYFDDVADFELTTIRDRQLIQIEVNLEDVYGTLDESKYGAGEWTTAAGKVFQLLELVEENAADRDLPQAPLTTTTGVLVNEQGVPIPEPCSILTPRVFRSLFGVPANGVTGHGPGVTDVFLSDRPVEVACERHFEAGNLSRPGPSVLSRFGGGGDWKVALRVEVFPSTRRAAKAFRKGYSHAPGAVVRSKADEASIKYSPLWDVTVSGFRVGPYIASVDYYGNFARAGIDFESVELPEPPRATTVRVFNALVPGVRKALKSGEG